MLRTALLLSGFGLITLTGACASATASAQERGWDGPSITCSSNDNRHRECDTPFRGRAVLVENISGTRCIEGSNWGSDRGRIWVDDGCRGRFVEGRNGGWGGGDGPGGGFGGIAGTVRCESNAQRQKICDTGWRRAPCWCANSPTRPAWKAATGGRKAAGSGGRRLQGRICTGPRWRWLGSRRRRLRWSRRPPPQRLRHHLRQRRPPPAHLRLGWPLWPPGANPPTVRHALRGRPHLGLRRSSRHGVGQRWLPGALRCALMRWLRRPAWWDSACAFR